ncbi:hypothetical protein, partial [Varibaculum cambriense]|uniref:hypothetical protein n=1 Tax=Varibaculum cambriense TaxID=184870 RepID=UPI00290296F4
DIGRDFRVSGGSLCLQMEGESTGEYETFIKHSPTIRPHLNLREKLVQLKSPRALRIPPALSPYASKLLPSKKTT